MSGNVYYSKRQDYGIIDIDNPTRKNAISIKMAQQLYSILDEIKDDRIKFLVIKSEGKESFCAGGDLNDYHANLSEQEAYDSLNHMKQVLMQLVTFPVLTICLLRGDAYGGGCELATACDIRIADESAFFAFSQSNLGILPGWGGGALLYEKVHSSFSLHWLTEGNRYGSLYLERKGWIHRIVASDEWENEQVFLDPYMTKSLEQLTHLKSQYLESLSVPTLLEKMEKESARCASLWGSAVHKNSLATFFNK